MLPASAGVITSPARAADESAWPAYCPPESIVQLTASAPSEAPAHPHGSPAVRFPAAAEAALFLAALITRFCIQAIPTVQQKAAAADKSTLCGGRARIASAVKSPH